MQTRLLPFNLHSKSVQVPEGLTIREMVDRVIPSKYPVSAIVTINGDAIPEFAWSSVRPKRHAIVGINVIPAGGGKKNPLATILSVALIVAAPYVAGWAAGATGGWIGSTFLGSQAIYGAVRLGMGMVGYLATSMLSSVPRQRTAAGNPAESPTQFIEGARNDILKYGVVPICLGTNRMFPPQAALPYTETVGDKQFVRQLFTWGYGKVVVENRRLGETFLNEFSDVDIEDRLDADLNSGTNLYANDVYQEPLAITLREEDGYVVRTTQPNADEASIDITFQGGLTEYNNFGERINTSVEFSVEFAPTGTGDWSTGVEGKSFGSRTRSIPAPRRGVRNKNILVMNIETGATRVIVNQGIGPGLNEFTWPWPQTPEGHVRLASFITSVSVNSPFTASVSEWKDDRASVIPSIIDNSSSFVPTYTGMTAEISAGTFNPRTFIVTSDKNEAVRVERKFTFIERGQYDVRIKRVTPDAEEDKVRDVATWTALRSITFRNPVNQKDISGTAIRIRGTDQLNGAVEGFNADVTSIVLDYFPDDDEWLEGPSSNPASIYRYVLQSPAFAKKLPDDRIDLIKLQEWHAYCVDKGLTYNRVIDYATSVEDVLQDVAAAGMATPHYVNSIYGVIIDNERPLIAGMVTPRNSWGYSGNINYPEIPHALRVEFRNSDAGYLTDEVIVYADGYDENNAELYERLSFPSCTNSDLAWFYGRMYLATAKLQPETHRFTMDFENKTFNRGDRIVFVNDVILVGVGSGRIKELIEDGGSIVGFRLDEVVTIPNSNSFGVRIRHADASGFVYYPLQTVVGTGNEFTFSTPVDAGDAPPIGSLCAFTEFGKELDLIVTDIKANPDQSAIITAINYAPERFDAASGAIPFFESNVTMPLELLAPLPPTLATPVQSDESVMIKNSDGSYIGRMVITLTDNNELPVTPVVRLRRVGATVWGEPDILVADSTRVILTGLEDGARYDINIKYQSLIGSRLMSPALELNGQKYIGASSIPADVINFRVASVNGVGLFEWNRSEEIDIDHYEIRFSRLTSGATWVNSQTVMDDIVINRTSLPMQSGTYFIKAFDILGNESVNPALIISYDNGALINVVEFLPQQPLFEGVKENCHVSGGFLYLTDPTLPGIYYFDRSVDLGDVYNSFISASVNATGISYSRVRDFDSIRSMVTVRGAGNLRIRDIARIRSLISVRGISVDDWDVQLQYRISQDDVEWTEWMDFIAGNKVFRSIEFRLLMFSNLPNINVRISTLEATVDMPDRIESQEDVLCPVEGVTITYSSPFINDPSVNITVQDGATDDRLEFVSRDSGSFTVKVFNATIAGYVERTFDYISSGYGRIL